MALTELRIGHVMVMDRAPNPRWDIPAGQIRYEIVRFEDGSESITFGYEEMLRGPRIECKRLDNMAAKTIPAGSYVMMGSHGVWWRLNGGGYRIEDGAD